MRAGRPLLGMVYAAHVAELMMQMSLSGDPDRNKAGRGGKA